MAGPDRPSFEDLAARVNAAPGDMALLQQLAQRAEGDDWSYDGARLADLFDAFVREASETDESLGSELLGAQLMAAGACTIPGLLRLLDEHPSALVRWHAGTTLALFPAHQEVIADTVIPHLAHPHGLIRRHVRWLLSALRPGAVPALIRAFEARPDDWDVIADALGFLGWSAESAVPVLEAARRVAPAWHRTAIESALTEIRGPWETDPPDPVPYLGEHLLFDDRFDAAHGGLARVLHRYWMWQEAAAWMMSHLRYLCEDDFPDAVDAWLDCEGWFDALEERTHQYLDPWRPDRVVVARPVLHLVAYDASGEPTRPQEVHSKDGRGFTMAELLYLAMDLQNRSTPRCYRWFEGVRQLEPGVYVVRTGS